MCSIIHAELLSPNPPLIGHSILASSFPWGCGPHNTHQPGEVVDSKLVIFTCC